MNSRIHGVSPSGRPSKPSWLRWAKCAVIVIVVAGLGHTVQSALRQIKSQSQAISHRLIEIQAQIDAQPSEQAAQELRDEQTRLKQSQPTMANIRWRLVFPAAGLYLIGLLPPAMFFHQTLLHMNQRPPIFASLRAHIMGHMGKYVPGKAMVVVIRSGAISTAGVRVSTSIVAAVIETLLMMAVGATLAAVLVLALDLPRMFSGMAVSLAVCAATPTLPPIFRFVVRRIAAAKPGVEKELQHVSIDWSLILCGWGWMILMWLAIASSFCLLVQASPGVDPGMFEVRDYLLASATIALAVVAGFVSLLPGGAGVRELVVSTLLAPRLGAANALFAAVLARLVFLGIDVLAGSLLMGWRQAASDKAEIDVD